jgi:glycosyltransferase involved in cell wall biosynthesis
MYESRSVGVVVPAYNEEPFVGGVVETMPAFVDRIYVVDDRSTDGTAEAALRAGERLAEARSDPDPEHDQDHGRQESQVESDGGSAGQTVRWREVTADLPTAADRYDEGPLGERLAAVRRVGPLFLLEHRENRGAGGAIKTGYLAALVDGVDVVATIDADGQMDPAELDRFVEPIVKGRADYTKGDRLSDLEATREMPRFRLFGNRLLTYLTRVASGYWDLMDPQNGYTAIRGETLAQIDVEGLFEYYGYTNDVLVRLNTIDATVLDVPLRAVYADEESHISLHRYVWRVWFMLVRNLLWRLRRTYLGGDGG